MAAVTARLGRKVISTTRSARNWAHGAPTAPRSRRRVTGGPAWSMPAALAVASTIALTATKRPRDGVSEHPLPFFSGIAVAEGVNNRLEPSERSLVDDARRIFEAAVAASVPGDAVEAAIEVVRTPGSPAQTVIRVGGKDTPLPDGVGVKVLAAGKAAAPMAAAVVRKLREAGVRVAGGCAVTKRGGRVVAEAAGEAAELRDAGVELLEAAHPVPDDSCEAAGRQLLKQAAEASSAGGEDPPSVVVFAVSGGASSLLSTPAPGLELEDIQHTTQLLLASGAPIGEVNTIRKHLSAVSGGRLAVAAGDAPVITLVLSDVVGDKLADIGSGPTFGDPSTFSDCLGSLTRRNLLGSVRPAVLRHLRAGARDKSMETPFPDSERLRSVSHAFCGNNAIATKAAARTAREMGYETLVLGTAVEGEAKEVAKVYAAVAAEVTSSSRPVAAPACIIAGGETTVTFDESSGGKGGRNQELALSAGIALDELLGEGARSKFDVAIMSCGTDGTDGPTDAAGGVVVADTVRRAAKSGVSAREFLASHDSYRFYARACPECLIKTGATGTNVMDIAIVLIRRKNNSGTRHVPGAGTGSQHDRV